MKTIEYKGMVYEIGKYYLFGDYENDISKYRKLKDIDPDKENPFEDERGEEFMYIKQLPSSDNFGTITDAPVELVDREIYLFDYNNGSSGMVGSVMRYCKSSNHFYFDNTYFDAKHCSNIRKMGVIEQ